MNNKRTSKVHGHSLSRDDVYSVNEILNKFQRKERIIVGVQCGSKTKQFYKLRLFAEKGVTCHLCGLKGIYFAKERHKGEENFHLNLYGRVYNQTTKEEEEVLFTIDHVLPISKGGSFKSLENMKPCCFRCNSIRGNKDEEEAESAWGENYLNVGKVKIKSINFYYLWLKVIGVDEQIKNVKLVAAIRTLIIIIIYVILFLK